MSSPRLPARYYALLAARMAQWGVDVPALLRDAGISAAQLQAPNAQLELSQMEALVTLASERSGRSDLGFELGRMLKLSSHDILGYAMLSAPSVDQALRIVSRYFGLITPTYSLSYRCDARVAEALVQPLLPLSPLAAQLHLEAIAVAYVEHVRSLLSGQAPACSLHLPFAQPAHVARYRELPSALVHFGEDMAGCARLSMDRATVMRPLDMADPNALRMAEARCAALSTPVGAGARLSDWVSSLLHEASEGPPGLGEVARMLNLSARTLERRLLAEGQGFRELARRARHERACALLAAPGASVTRIAHQLGYTDAANFTRAFRRDAGVAPSAFRAMRG